MSELIRIIKQAAVEAVEEAKPVGIIFGSVLNSKPLKLRINPKLVLDKDFLLVPEHLRNTAFEKGDNVILLRAQGGQAYVILGKTGGGGNVTRSK